MAEPDEKPKTAPEVSEGREPNEPKSETPPVDSHADNELDTDNAVEDIVRKESDDELKAQDDAAERSVVMKLNHREKLKQALRNWWENPRKRWGTITATLVVLLAVFAVPFTRYEILGIFVREKVTVQAVDSESGLPVSGAEVQIGGSKAETDAEGRALLHPHTGSRQLLVSKKYYKGSAQSVLITMSASQNTFKANLVALGRQVKVKLVDKISGKSISDAKVTVSGSVAKTDKNGMANVVLPSGSTSRQASVSLNGYNNASVAVDANGNLAQNTFTITPSGKIYFLSNLSGNIDVVKTNLDGTDRQTVLAGTGNEDPHSTSLLASRDWKYLALLSKRSGNSASLFLIDTTNGDKLTTIDQGSAQFTLVGWSGDHFVYEVNRQSVNSWQSGQQALKSFDPTTGHSLPLDQTQASGTSNVQFAGQFYGSSYLIGSSVVYTKGWQSDSMNYMTELAGKSVEVDSIDADGTNHRTIKTFAVTPTTNYFNLGTQLYEPEGLYIYYYQGSDGNQFYKYENGKVTADTSLTSDTFYNTPYPTYLLSPSSNNTFWTEQRDGKNTLFTGDENGDNKQQIATLSDYSPYGWYTDNYLLVSKDSSELYAMPANGGKVLKITDYYKPPINYNGYGGGYGGL